MESENKFPIFLTETCHSVEFLQIKPLFLVYFSYKYTSFSWCLVMIIMTGQWKYVTLLLHVILHLTNIDQSNYMTHGYFA